MTEPEPTLLPVPAGTLEVSDARTGTTRVVALERFRLGRAPVTNAEHRRVVEATRGTGDATGGPPPDRRTDDGRDDVPVHGITWFDAVRWCNAASSLANLEPAYRVEGRDVLWDVAADGYRLPTEAEWEHACRGATSGPTYAPLAEVAWTAADDVAGPQPVGRRLPNAYGLVDTLGNVWEWCWDYADTARYGEYRSLRGGGWADRPWSVRAGVRRGSAPDARIEDVGFRVARGPAGTRGAAAGQGWSDAADRRRAQVRGLVPLGWTPLRFPPGPASPGHEAAGATSQDVVGGGD